MKLLFTPYTYLLTHKPSGRRYYGVRYGKGCHPSDLFVSYFSSSKIVNKLISETGIDSFSVEIRKTFKTRHEAINWEHRVLKRLDVNHKDQWINDHNGSTPSPESQLRGAQAKKPWALNDPRRFARKDEKWKELARANIAKSNTPEQKAKRKQWYIDTKEDRRRAKISRAKKLYNPLTVSASCDYCGALGNIGSIKRWHNDNCRHKLIEDNNGCDV